MHEIFPSSDEHVLSEDDLAVLKAFDAMAEWPVSRTDNPDTSSNTSTSSVNSHLTSDTLSSTPSYQEEEDEMLAIFLDEVQEDISKMSYSLSQLKQDPQLSTAYFVTLQRSGHKLHGTAAAIDFPLLSTIAAHVETISEQVQHALIFPVSGVHALSLGISLLAQVLQEISLHGREPASDIYLTQLDTLYHNLHIDLSQPAISDLVSPPLPVQPQDLSPVVPMQEEHVSLEADDYLDEDTAKHPAIVMPLSFLPINTDSTTNDAASLEHHNARLLERQIQLEDAQSQVEAAFHDMHAAQTRLQRLEKMLPLFLTHEQPHVQPADSLANLPSSSFVARILHDLAPLKKNSASANDGQRYHPLPANQSASWDELDLEQYTEKDLLLRSLSEAIADVTVCCVHANKMYMHLSTLQQEYIAQVSHIRQNMLSLSIAPLRSLLPHLQQAIALLEQKHACEIVFTVTGEETEVDRDLLRALSTPLTQLLQVCIATPSPSDDSYSTLTGYDLDAAGAADSSSDSVSFTREQYSSPLSRTEKVQHVSLRAHKSTYDVIIEVDFSLPTNSGALDAIYPALQRINCYVTTRSNTTGGVVFSLRLPHAHTITRSLLVRSGSQDLLVPFVQVQHIGTKDAGQVELCYDLHTLLGFPATSSVSSPSQPLLMLPVSPANTTIGVVVDEVISDVELATKQLHPYLQRPGIIGTAIDGKGRALLMLDLLALVQRYQVHAPRTISIASDEQNSLPHARKVIHILLADDSVSVRRSVKRMLQSPQFVVAEAHDGVEALEMMLEHVPDILLLDIEMPNLNGYDLLHILPNYPKLARVHTVMLSSRSSNKHQQRARELGACAYLTKPTTPEILLEVIQSLHR